MGVRKIQEMNLTGLLLHRMTAEKQLHPMLKAAPTIRDRKDQDSRFFGDPK